MEGAETPCCPATAPKPERSGEDLYGGVGQNPCCSVCKPGQELQETSDLCNCKQRFLYQILSSIFLLYQIHIACNTFFFSDSVSHSWCVPMMKITDLSILCKWKTLKNRQCIKYLFVPLYIFNYLLLLVVVVVVVVVVVKNVIIIIIYIYIYIYIYNEQNYRHNTFVFAPIFHELTSTI